MVLDAGTTVHGPAGDCNFIAWELPPMTANKHGRRQPSGYWAIPQAIAWIAFGDPCQMLFHLGLGSGDVALAEIMAAETKQPYERPPPFDQEPYRKALDELIDQMLGNPNQDTAKILNEAGTNWWLRKFIDDAEKTLVSDFQLGRITISGRPQREFIAANFTGTARVEITHLDLQAEVTLHSRLHLTSQSWIVVRDPSFPGVEKCWRDVLIPEARLRELHPKSMLAGHETAQANSSEVRAQEERPPPPDPTVSTWAIQRLVIPVNGRSPERDGVMTAHGARRRGGRKGSPYWPEAHKAILKQIDEEGPPDSGHGGQARLIEWISTWLAKRDHHPAKSTVQKHVKACVAEYLANPSMPDQQLDDHKRLSDR
jgi:hypothetical protein